MVHSVYMAFDQCNKIPSGLLPLARFEEVPPGGGDADLVVVSTTGNWVIAYQFKGVNGLGNIARNANGAAEQLRNVPLGTRKIVSIEVRNGTHKDFVASADPSKGYLGYMGGINAFKTANPDVTLRVRFSDGVVQNF